MENEPTLPGLSRRSFIKRSVVASVAVSSMSVLIFSGMVYAAGEGLTGSGVVVPPAPVTGCMANTYVTKEKCCEIGGPNLHDPARSMTKCTDSRNNVSSYCYTNTQTPLRDKDGHPATGCNPNTGSVTY